MVRKTLVNRGVGNSRQWTLEFDIRGLLDPTAWSKRLRLMVFFFATPVVTSVTGVAKKVPITVDAADLGIPVAYTTPWKFSFIAPVEVHCKITIDLAFRMHLVNEV
ncbi:hypothetical protein CLF_111584 [Clonorchis sinensis]|uniref:Uncharacterized protein n=1 Tax=Clonorchis sinensis TaxID=79923 RepID=G7YLR9_CLOSI|nr:hypothetical protein CLF_111584 [Clonorchis sinensis]